MNNEIYNIFIGLFSAINIVFFIFLIVSLSSKKRINKSIVYLLIMVVSGFLWLTAVYFLGVHFVPLEILIILIRIDFALAVIVVYSLLLFLLNYPRREGSLLTPKEFISSIPAIALICLSFSKIFLDVPAPRVYEPTFWYAIYLLVIISYFLASLFIALKKLKELTGIDKKRLMIFSFSILISFSILFIESVISNYRSGGIPVAFDRLILNTSLIFSFFATYSILRYRFLDIALVVKKGFVQVFSLIFTLGIYTYVVLQLRTSIEKAWDASVGWTAAVLILVTVVGFIPVKKGVEYLVNKMFKGRKSIDLAVAELKKDISEQSDAATLAKLVTAQTRRFLDVGEAHVYLGKPGEELVSYGNGGDRITRDNDVVRYFQKYREPVVREEISHMMDEREGEFERDALQKVEKEMKKQKVAIAMPFVHEDGLYGLLTIGERETKEAFSVQDIQFLTKLREEIGFTLASALQYSYAMERIRVMQEKGEL